MTIEDAIKYTLALCPEGQSTNAFLAHVFRIDRSLACLVLTEMWNSNRLIVSHEDGRHDTVTNIEVNPAGELVIWLEA